MQDDKSNPLPTRVRRMIWGSFLFAACLSLQSSCCLLYYLQSFGNDHDRESSLEGAY